MNVRNINKHLRAKFAEWLKSIEDPELRKLMVEGAFITGGCIVSLLLDEHVNDYDIYLRTPEAAQAIAEYYVNQFKEESGQSTGIAVVVDGDLVKIVISSKGVAGEGEDNDPIDEILYSRDPIELADTSERGEITKYEVVATNDATPPKKPYRPIFLSSNAITLSDHIQIIVRFTGSPTKVHENFDFVHCTNYWTPDDKGLHLNKDALASITTKQLQYTGSKYPVCSLFRLRKFLARGWHITAGQILKISLQVSDLDLNDFAVLEDQLIGVDVSYFRQMLDNLKENESETDGQVNRGYLLTIIDDIF